MSHSSSKHEVRLSMGDFDEERGSITMSCRSNNNDDVVHESTESTFDDSDSSFDDFVDIPIDSDEAASSLPTVEGVKAMLLNSPDGTLRRRLCFGALVLCAVLLVVGTSVSAMTASTKQTVVADMKPTTTAERATIFDIKQFLIRHEISDKYDLHAKDSPQHLASHWLANHDEAALPIPSNESIDDSPEAYLFMTRYIMALNYFATGGDEHWKHSLGFLSRAGVCDWWDTITSGGNKYPTGLMCDGSGVPQSMVLGKSVACFLV